MALRICDLIPNPDDLLELEGEELAGLLLVHINSLDADPYQPKGPHSYHNFFAQLEEHPGYPRRQSEVNRALMEAWGWLRGEGFLVESVSSSPGWFFVSKRGKRLKSRENFAAYLKVGLLPNGQLHPLVASKVYPAFLRGEYDTAVFQAFREVEIAVRDAFGFPDEAVGTGLMRDAFRPAGKTASGPLTDAQLPVAEREGMASLFAGAIGLYKNPQSHRNVPTDAADAAEAIMFASHLLRIVDRRKP